MNIRDVIPTDPADPNYADLLETFLAFPAPLALMDATGSSELVNSRFLQRFAAEGVSLGQFKELTQNPPGVWQPVSLLSRKAAAAEISARAVRTIDHIFLVVDEPGVVVSGGDLESLRARIGELERLIATDRMTGAWSRAHLDRIIESERGRSLESHHPISLLLIDIDHFKSVNDAFGQAAGDSVLRELVQRVRRCIRASDLLFRRDRDEFVVLASSTGYHGAERMAENLRQNIASNAFEVVGTVTISLGVAEHDGDESVATWFRRLDESLNQAKGDGRNRVVVSRRGNSQTWAAQGGYATQYLIWRQDYECGDAVIDGEHREIFQLVNILIEAALSANEEPGVGLAAVNDVLAQVVRHFADEEAILDRLNYARLSEHRLAHAGLVQRTRWMARLLKEGKLHALSIVEFIAQDVVAGHLRVVDRAFFPMFRNATPAPAAAQTR